MTKSKSETNKEYAKKLAMWKKEISKWSDKEIEEHQKNLEKYYKSDVTPSYLLGDFKWDQNFDYMWHAMYDGHAHNLHRRKSLGWEYASHEDAERAGIDITSAQSDLDGGSYVLADHKNVRAILLKIPKELNRLNREAIRAIRNKENLNDVYGRIVRESLLKSNDKSITIQRDEGVIEADKL